MPDLTSLGKRAENKIKEWLNHPEDGFCFDRLPDQMTGFFGSSNICDFTLFKSPNYYYIESKATYQDRFDFSMITDYQYKNMLKKSAIRGVTCYVIVLFASHQRAFMLNIRDIDNEIQTGHKSINITKISKWKIPYIELDTIPSKKELLDYESTQRYSLF